MVATSRLFDRLVLALIVAVIVAPITYMEVVRPSWQQMWTDAHRITNHLPHAGASTTPVPATSTKLHSTPAAPNPATTKTATTNSYVHLRAGESVNSAVLDNIPAGTTVQLTSGTDPTWQGVSYQSKTGYIYRAYLNY